MSGVKTKWVVLASGEGTTVEALHVSPVRINFEIVGVVSTSPAAGVVGRCKKLGIPVQVIEPSILGGPEIFVQKLIEGISSFAPDFILLIGYLRKLEVQVINRFPGQIFNSHPSLLPKYGGKGMYGSRVHQSVFEAREVISGVTVHVVNGEYDRGKIQFQGTVDIASLGTWQEVESVVKAFEKKFLVRCLNEDKKKWTGG